MAKPSQHEGDKVKQRGSEVATGVVNGVVKHKPKPHQPKAQPAGQHRKQPGQQGGDADGASTAKAAADGQAKGQPKGKGSVGESERDPEPEVGSKRPGAGGKGDQAVKRHKSDIPSKAAVGQAAPGKEVSALALTGKGEGAGKGAAKGVAKGADGIAKGAAKAAAKHTSKASAKGKGDAKGKGVVAVVAAAAAGVSVSAAPKGKTAGFSSNWEAMKAVLGATGDGKKRQASKAKEAVKQVEAAATKLLESKGSDTGVTKIVAMDCEMVGVGPNGKRSAIARVCMINNDGNVLLDAYVKPKETVTDYRTWVSGILPEHLKSKDALTLEEAQEKVAKILKGATLVGHALHNDLQAMLLDHPRKDMRDTAKYPPLMAQPAPGRKPKPRSLKKLALEQLGIAIQDGSHSPVDDARAALYIYHKHRKDWERAIATGGLRKAKQESAAQRKAVREAMQAKAGSEGAARKARLGRGKGQVKIAQALMRDAALSAGGKVDPFKRDVRDDPYADL